MSSRAASSPSGSAARLPLAALWLASAAVLAACVLASFRQGFGDDISSAVRVNGPRVLLAAAAGAAFALAGAVRLQLGREHPLRGLAVLALSAGGAGGGFAAAEQVGAGAAALPAFGLGALLGGGLGLGAVRVLARPRRGTNPGAALLLAAAIGVAAVAGSYARARQDLVAPLVQWLLGDLSGATAASAGALALLAAALVGAALRSPDAARLGTLGLLALGVGLGAAGPLAFVGSLVPRAVRWLADSASARARLATSALAGAATVAALDAVPRLLVGGYDFPFNVAAGMLAIPVFLGWNRARLRREVGPAAPLFETAEIGLIAAMTLAGTALVWTLARVIAAAT